MLKGTALASRGETSQRPEQDTQSEQQSTDVRVAAGLCLCSNPNPHTFAIADILDLLTGEHLLSSYRGVDYKCFGDNCLMARRDTIWLTNRRIVIQETMTVLGLRVVSSQASFRYKDLQHLSLKIDYRLKFLFVTAVSLYGQSELIGRDNHFLAFLGVILFIIGVLCFLYYLAKFFLKEELHLDFYKEETVNTWLYLLEGFFRRRYGSSITKSLNLTLEDSYAVIKELYEHDLTQFAEDKIE